MNSKNYPLKRKGHLLEETIASLFLKAGFKVKKNAIVEGYEIDVLAELPAFKIIIECKQYKKSKITISSYLHQWASKGKYLKANRVILVISGVRIKKELFKLSKKLNIILIDDKILQKLITLDKNKLRKELNLLLKFNEEQYKKDKRIYYIKSFIKIAYHAMINLFLAFLLIMGLILYPLLVFKYNIQNDIIRFILLMITIISWGILLSPKKSKK